MLLRRASIYLLRSSQIVQFYSRDNVFYLLNLNSAKAHCVLFFSRMRQVTGGGEKNYKFALPAKWLEDSSSIFC